MDIVCRGVVSIESVSGIGEIGQTKQSVICNGIWRRLQRYRGDRVVASLVNSVVPGASHEIRGV